MISFVDFRNKYRGRGVDQDGFPKSNPYQCMDLMHFYVREVLGLDSGQLRAGSAWLSFSKGGADFEKIAYYPGFVPQNGDIIYWNQRVWVSGHVAIFIEGDRNSFLSFDQNWPVGTLCHEQRHTYTAIAGVLRKRQQKPTPPPQPAPKPEKPQTNNQSNEECMTCKRHEVIHARYTLRVTDDQNNRKYFITRNGDGKKDRWNVADSELLEVIEYFDREIVEQKEASILKGWTNDNGNWSMLAAIHKYPELALVEGQKLLK